MYPLVYFLTALACLVSGLVLIWQGWKMAGK